MDAIINKLFNELLGQDTSALRHYPTLRPSSLNLLTHELRKTLLKTALPAFGESLDIDCATKQFDIVLLAGIKSGDMALGISRCRPLDSSSNGEAGANG